MILLRYSGKPKIVSPGNSSQHSAVSQPVYRKGREGRKVTRDKGPLNFWGSFATFASVAVKLLYLRADG
jgi:hypothetical protein